MSDIPLCMPANLLLLCATIYIPAKFTRSCVPNNGLIRHSKIGRPFQDERFWQGRWSSYEVNVMDPEFLRFRQA